MAKPIPMPIPLAPAPPGFSAAFSMELAAWNWAYLWRSPMIPMLVRLSSACSTSGGSEMFSTHSRTTSRPNSAKSSLMRDVTNWPSSS